MGYAAGDDLLCEVARRLFEVLRESDTVARLGSDDFGILLASTHSLDGAAKVAERICNEVARKTVIAGQPFDILLSVGIAMFPEHGTDADTLLRHADVALAEARRARLPYAVFSSDGPEPSRRALHLAADLRSAIENDELTLHYQPKVCMRTRRTVGVEALVRWQHPSHGLIMPGDFMAIAERTALITPMSLKIVDKALAQCRLWRESGLNVPVAVNLSPRSLHQTDLADRIADSLTKAQVGADQLSIEITETAIMVDEAVGETGVRRLADLGLRISIDDFGTGYSSLARLRRLPVSELKVDRSFVRDMVMDGEDAAIVRALVDLGHRLGKTIVAEGVEDAKTLDLLAEWGCDTAQGYHLCRPGPADQITSWLVTSPFGCGGGSASPAPAPRPTSISA
jgi:predicted signal transduction protein with EAL and GGDEF domain